jgi:hypothetical protein
VRKNVSSEYTKISPTMKKKRHIFRVIKRNGYVSVENTHPDGEVTIWVICYRRGAESQPTPCPQHLVSSEAKIISKP